ncbi:hypothetical protein HanHA300_Chr15g0563551 [Helianthus annuus]|nr:hypothetical protein HanHA300_Chr15g0563551 [Helianthus annuus]KAJ0472946.1 hypothetical protein HanHA89_Chr15g0612781 [Helianthus annuus]KAJ0648551.1 hypothetical protein HanLR1_Chr15g0574181 [Helianthus annuus]
MVVCYIRWLYWTWCEIIFRSPGFIREYLEIFNYFKCMRINFNFTLSLVYVICTFLYFM